MAAGSVRSLFGVAAEGYKPHAVDRAGRTYLETNCYTDVLIELLHARGDEPHAELLAALRIIEAMRRGEVGFGRFNVSRLAGGLGECRLVLALEFLHGGEGDYLGGVQAAAIAHFLADPAGGVIEDRRLDRGPIGIAPGVGFLPHVRDVLRSGGLPPPGLEHRPQARGREHALGVDLGFHVPGGLFAVAPSLLNRVLPHRDRTPRRDGGGGQCEL